MSWIGIDVGGTFTDAVAYDGATGELRAEKAPTTPDAPQEGVLNALERLGTPLDKVERLIHGLTLATNTVLERDGADVWIVTNRGFRDTLEIARTNRPVLFNIKTLKVAPLVPRNRILEISERSLSDGSELRPIDDAELDQVIEVLKKNGAEAVAVCLLHSYANAKNEQAVVEKIQAALPGSFVTGSAEVLPEFREYERFTTAALNAYAGPRTGNYLSSLDEAVGSRGYGKPVYIMTSNGGVFTAGRAARFPVNTILSGPAGGVAAAAALGEAINIRNLITYDMGGTSTDVCLLENLIVPVTNEQFISGYPNRTPQIEINTVGAGGGSLALLDEGTTLRVGPESASAVPGPACYGRGGTEPTVTDANLHLGRLTAGATLGGAVGLDAELARGAIERLNAKLEHLDSMELAEGVIRIAVARMVSAIKEISIGKGHDPRDFSLLAYGGAGPMHATLIAEELEIPQVVVPLNPGNFSAYGAILSDVRNDYVRTRLLPLKDDSVATIDSVFSEMEAEGRQVLETDQVDCHRVAMRRACGMRYAGQSWELVVEIPENAKTADDIAQAFHEAHRRRYGLASDDPIEIVNFRLAVIGEMSKPGMPEWTVAGSLPDAQRETRKVFIYGEWHETPVYDRELLPTDTTFEGPAIVEESSSVTIVPPGWRGSIGRFGVLLLDRIGASK